MSQRLPAQLLGNLLLTTASADIEYTVPANNTLTVSALSLNNTTATARLVTANAIPSGQTIGATNEVVSELSVPIKGAQPTTVPGLVGQHFAAGTKIQFKADAAAAVSIIFSGYLTTP